MCSLDVAVASMSNLLRLAGTHFEVLSRHIHLGCLLYQTFE